MKSKKSSSNPAAMPGGIYHIQKEEIIIFNIRPSSIYTPGHKHCSTGEN